MKEEKKTELDTEYITYIVRYDDDGHEDNKVLGKFKIIHTIYDDWCFGSFISIIDDGV